MVRFTVAPYSIKHDFVGGSQNSDKSDEVTVNDPIESCSPSIPSVNRQHTSYEMAKTKAPQPASGKVLFTYDVVWIQSDYVDWDSRWHIYVTMDNAIPDRIHFFSMMNSIMISLFLLFLLLGFLSQSNPSSKLARSNFFGKVMKCKMKSDNSKINWIEIRFDFFDPPSFSPVLLSIACGSGAQLLSTVFPVLLLMACNAFGYETRRALVMTSLICFSLSGFVAGWVQSRMCKAFFEGKMSHFATLTTALAFPGLCFAIFLFEQVVAKRYGSAYAVPSETINVLILLWFGVLVPLVYMGAFAGNKQETIELPIIQPGTALRLGQPKKGMAFCFSIPMACFIGGILPFAAVFVELYYVMCSVWQGYFYYSYGYLFVKFCCMILTSAFTSSVLILLSLWFRQDNGWWWRSFCIGGSGGLSVFLYSLVYFLRFDYSSFFLYTRYFGWMGLASIGLFLMLGFVGVTFTFWYHSILINGASANWDATIHDSSEKGTFSSPAEEPLLFEAQQLEEQS